MNKKWMLAGEAFSEALCDCSILLPGIIFTGLALLRYSDWHNFLPLVLFYTSENAALFFMASLGKVTNPYKILKYLLYFTMAGSFILCLGSRWAPFWSIGSVFLGFGLSAFNPLYRTLRDLLRKNGDWKKDASSLAGLLLFGLLLGVAMLLRHDHIGLVFGLLFAFIASVTFFIHKMDVSELRLPDRMFTGRVSSWRKYILPVCVLLAMLFTMLFRQTGESIFLALMILVLVLALVGKLTSRKKEGFRPCTARCMWFGAVRNYLSVFSIITFTALDNYRMLMFAVAMVVVGTGISKLLLKPLLRLTGESHFETVCILGTSIMLLMMLFSNDVFYLTGVALSCAFAAMGSDFLTNSYLEDESIPETERWMVNYKMYNLGGIIQQLMLMLLLALAALICQVSLEDPITAYFSGNGSVELAPVFIVACILCVFGLVASGIATIGWGRRSKRSSIET